MGDSGLAKLASDLRNAGDKAENAAVNAVRKSGKRTERAWRINAVATARQHGKHYPRAVTTDHLVAGGGWITAEVGPDKGRTQGPLGNLLEFGSRNNPAHKDGDRALTQEAPRFIRAMEKAGDMSL